MKEQNNSQDLGSVITLPCYGIVIQLTEPNKDGLVGGSISSDLHEEPDGPDDDPSCYNAAMDGLESIVLAHAIAGVDVESPAYIEGLETAVGACGNNL